MFYCRKCFLMVLLVLVVSGGMSFAVQAASGKTVKVFAVGNSFARNADQYRNELNAADPENELQLTVAYIGGCSLETHVKLARVHEQNPADPKGKPYPIGKEMKSLKELLTADKWDYITIQQFSWLSPDINSYRPWAKDLCDYIKKYCPDVPIVVYETWAYRSDDSLFKDGKRTDVDMYHHLHAAYQTIAGELGNLPLIPVGTAFYNALQRPDWQFCKDEKFDPSKAVYPELPDQTHSLHVGWYWKNEKDGSQKLVMDGHHAGNAGCFLAGLVWREFFLGVDARNNKFVPKEIGEADAVILRQVAHDAVAGQVAKK